MPKIFHYPPMRRFSQRSGVLFKKSAFLSVLSGVVPNWNSKVSNFAAKFSHQVPEDIQRLRVLDECLIRVEIVCACRLQEDFD